MPTKKEIPQDLKQVHLNNALPILYVDAVNIRHRADGYNYVSLATRTPHRLVEQVRLMIDDSATQLIVDALCESIDYYPKEPSKNQRPQAK